MNPDFIPFPFCRQRTWRWLALVAFLLVGFGPARAFAQAGRIYTKPDAASTGGITGKVPVELTHAVAAEHDHVHIYLADLTDSGKTFRFEHLPIGKYDLVLVAKNGAIYEGLALGDDSSKLSEPSMANLKARIKAADTFFNQFTIHRIGVIGFDPSGTGPGDGVALAFVERYRANDVLKQSAEKLNQLVRRLEVIELHQATDDWQMTNSRHLYREGEPIPATPQFLKHLQVPALGNLRIVSTMKDLGQLPLPQ